MIKMVKIPRMLLDHEYYKNLSDRAKVLYGLLWEKKQEAERYGWLDKEGSPYVIFPKKKMQEELACSRYRLDLVTRELVATDLIELVYGVGDSLERRIYVHNLDKECPWIRVMYGTAMTGQDTAAEPGIGAEDPHEEKAATKEEVREGPDSKESRERTGTPVKGAAALCGPEGTGWTELIAALASLLLEKMADRNDGPPA